MNEKNKAETEKVKKEFEDVIENLNKEHAREIEDISKKVTKNDSLKSISNTLHEEHSDESGSQVV